MRKNTMKNKSLPGKCCDATFAGLSVWYKTVFEQLGWMVLAREYGMTDKVKVYVNSIYRINMSIEQKMKKTTDKDRLDDLRIMQKNVKVLLAHVQKDFKM